MIPPHLNTVSRILLECAFWILAYIGHIHLCPVSHLQGRRPVSLRSFVSIPRCTYTL